MAVMSDIRATSEQVGVSKNCFIINYMKYIPLQSGHGKVESNKLDIYNNSTDTMTCILITHYTHCA